MRARTPWHYFRLLSTFGSAKDCHRRQPQSCLPGAPNGVSIERPGPDFVKVDDQRNLGPGLCRGDRRKVVPCELGPLDLVQDTIGSRLFFKKQ